jgi:hypothetical protein
VIPDGQACIWTRSYCSAPACSWGRELSRQSWSQRDSPWDRQDLLGDQAGCLIQALKAVLTSENASLSVSDASRCQGHFTTRPRKDLGSPLPRSRVPSRPGAARPPERPWAALDATAGRPTHAPPTGGRVVALGEVVGMARVAILETCPPGEGTFRIRWILGT